MRETEAILAALRQDNPGQEAFYQAVSEVLTTIEPALSAYDKYEQSGILERLVEPDRQLMFRVPWTDDAGRVRVNRGYRIQFNNAIGPYKGGIRLHPSVNLDIIKFLGFEQTFKNALTGLPLGGAKGGSNFDPKGKSEGEIMRFCQSFMTELYQHISADRDVPAGDIGTGAREIGYLFGQYRRLTEHFEGTLTGKGLSFGGSLLRTEATGYGLVYMANEVLHAHNRSLSGLRVNISGAGNVATYAAEKAISCGARVQTMSDSSGFIFDPDGIDVSVIKRIKEQERRRIEAYLEFRPKATFTAGRGVWRVPCDVALPCATQNELTGRDAKVLTDNGVYLVAEGANMPSTPEAIDCFLANGVYYVPGKAANAGGVATSGLEMSQNSMRVHWTREEVDEKLAEIMAGIFRDISETAKAYGQGENYMAGANIAGFLRVSTAMLTQGVC